MKLYKEENGTIVRTRDIMEADHAVVKTVDDLNRLIECWGWYMPFMDRSDAWHFGVGTFDNLENGKAVFCYRGGRFHTTSVVNDFRG